ncbi:recombinase family protein [Clostridium sp. 1001271B_151109_B4]|uniref:recombinase family protein n=1 Tax=Clostridium sp. 1001271B_151109_B4 TaxID=2787148 RepID=UPI0018AC7785
MKLGYVRVSFQDQNEEIQIRQLNEVGVDFIHKGKVSGATINREKLNEMINNYLRTFIR